MIYQHLLEQRAKATKAQKARFAKDINRLIRNTGKLERAKVEAMVKLLQRSRNDLSDIIVGLPKGPFRADMAELLKSQVQELLTDFQNKAIPELAVAQEEFAVVGQEFTDELIRSQARRPPIIAIKPEIIENAATRSADLIRSLSTRQVRRASDLINRSVITGDSVGELAQKMRKEFSKGIAQMETIVRTEVLGIHSQVQMAELQAMVIDTPGLHKQWITVRDGRQRPDHDAAHLQSVPVDVPFRIGRDLLQFPRDPAAPAGQVINCRCVAPGTIVEGAVIAAMRTKYYGPMITLKTRTGKNLTVTAQHPILTDAGFVKADSLNHGDKLICQRSDIENAMPGNSDIHLDHAPSTVEDVFSSLSKGPSKRVRKSRDDFYGDGRFTDGDVDVVGPACLLLNDRELTLSKNLGNIILPDSALRDKALAGESHILGPGRERGTVTLDPAPLNAIRFGPASRIDASIDETIPNRPASQPISACDRKLGISTPISVKDFVKHGKATSARPNNDSALGKRTVEISRTDANLTGHALDILTSPPASDNGIDIDNKDAPSYGHPIPIEQSINPGMRDSKFLADLKDRFTGFVFTDEIIEIKRWNYSGHVYDLQTLYGWFSADGIISKNCTMVPDFSGVEGTEDAPTAAALETKDLAPPEIKLGDLARRVAADVKESFAIQR